jgi:hypothetical protein
MTGLVFAAEHAGYDGTADRVFAIGAVVALVLWLVINLARDARTERAEREDEWRPLP